MGVRRALGVLSVTTLVACAPGPGSSGSIAPIATTAPTESPAVGLTAPEARIYDPKGDLVDALGRKAARNPQLDVTQLAASADGRNLSMTLTFAGTVPRYLTVTSQEVKYQLMIEADHSGDLNYVVSVENRDDGSWAGVLTDFALGQDFKDDKFPGTVLVGGDNIVSIAVPLTLLGDPDQVRIALITQRAQHSNGTVVAEDHVPEHADAQTPTSKWLTLGSVPLSSESPAASTPPSP